MISFPPRAAVCVLAACSASILAGCDTQTGTGDAGEGAGRVTYLGKESIPADPAQMVLEQTCMSCHATGVGPVITGRNLPPDAVKLFVRNGSRAMPAFTEAMLDDETLDAVARLIAESPAPSSPPTS